MLHRLTHPFAIDLEMLAAFRWLLAAIVIWGLVGRSQIRDYLFELPPAVISVGDTDHGRAAAGVPGQSPVATDARSVSGRPLLYDSRDSRSVWTPWHWSILWLDQVVERIRTTLLSVRPVGAAGDSMGVESAEDGPQRDQLVPPVDLPPVHAAWSPPLERMRDFFASQWWFDCVLGLGIASAILFAVGLFTKTANLVLWVVLVSLQHRLPLFNSGADSLERLFVFWLLFLPAGAVGSLDAWWFPRQGFWRKRINQTDWRCPVGAADSPLPTNHWRTHSICSWASAAILLQLVAIYFYSALEKLNADWWQGNAVAASLQWGFIAKPWAASLLEVPHFLRVVTWSVLLMELLCPLLVFCPYLFGYTRRATMVFFVGMHLGIAATLSIGTFSAVCLVGWLLFLPAAPLADWTWRSWWRDPRDRSIPLPRLIPGSSRSSAMAAECGVVILLLVSGWWNLSQASVLRDWVGFPRQLQPLVCQLGLDPNFPMFGRVPSRNYGWEHRVELENGRSLNLRPDLPTPLNLPNRVAGWFESPGVFLWRQLHVNLLYLEDQQPDFVWMVRDQLRALEFEVWQEQLRQSASPLVKDLDSAHSELIMIDLDTHDEFSWSITDL